jgi:hypothetical protein
MNLALVRQQLSITTNRDHAEEQRIMASGDLMGLFSYIAKREAIDEIFYDQKWRAKIQRETGHDPYHKESHTETAGQILGEGSFTGPVEGGHPRLPSGEDDTGIQVPY